MGNTNSEEDQLIVRLNTKPEETDFFRIFYKPTHDCGLNI